METITYEYKGGLYVNLTNRCDCNCVFCLRHNGHKGSIYADDLWLDHEPTREEALADFLRRDLTSYREIVFCGFGEPMYRWGRHRLAHRRPEGQMPPAAPGAHQHQRPRGIVPGPGRDPRAVRPGGHGVHLPQRLHGGGVLRRHPAQGRPRRLEGHAGLTLR